MFHSELKTPFFFSETHKAFSFGPTQNGIFYSSNLLVEAVNQEVNYSQSCSKIKVRMESRAEMRKFEVGCPTQSLFLWVKCGRWWCKHLYPLPSAQAGGLPARGRKQQCPCGISGSPVGTVVSWHDPRNVLHPLGCTRSASGDVSSPCTSVAVNVASSWRVGRKNRREKKKRKSLLPRSCCKLCRVWL